MLLVTTFIKYFKQYKLREILKVYFVERKEILHYVFLLISTIQITFLSVVRTFFNL